MKHALASPAGPLYRLAWSLGSAVLAVLLSSCGSNDSLSRDVAHSRLHPLAVRYSIVCIVRGDGDYVYHDSLGETRAADEEALAGAVRVARNNPYAEVFIFHEKPRRSLLFLVPLPDGEFSYYRNGDLRASTTYQREGGPSRFDRPVGLYEEFRDRTDAGVVRILLYFGHELAEVSDGDDNTESPDQPLTVHDLAGGLQAMVNQSARFDLVVLSSCFNGTPYTIASLSPYARIIVASPDNLHLSYFDQHAFEQLNLEAHDGDVRSFAKGFASTAFNRLSADLETAVTVAVYDVDRVQAYLHSVDSVDRALTKATHGALFAASSAEHCDCADNPAYALPAMSNGVDIFFRSARFGRARDKQVHSGWECWRERLTRAATAESQESTEK